MGKKKAKKPVVLVFGEDDYDRQSIAELVRALCPEAPPVRKRQSPLVLVKGREAAEAEKNAKKAAGVVRAAMRKADVRLVIAHQDCDAVEPAHIALSGSIESTWGKEMPCPVVAATPAFEMETWWFLFPDAVAKVVSAWRPLPRGNRDVGNINNAKEALTRALRPNTKKKPRDYTESDASEVARHVRELEVVQKPIGKSNSFLRFANAIIKHLCPPKQKK